MAPGRGRGAGVLLALGIACLAVQSVDAEKRKADEGINTMNDLYEVLKNDKRPRMGFLSRGATERQQGFVGKGRLPLGLTDIRAAVLGAGEFKAVQHVLPDREDLERLVDYMPVDDLIKKVKHGKLTAAMLHGRRPVAGDPELNVFSSGVITPRASLFRRGREEEGLVDAFNAALVRSIDRGERQAIQAQNAPFESLDVQTCNIEPRNWRFPGAEEASGALKKAIKRGKLLVGAVGPTDWGIAGNYSDVDDPTGFWPEYLQSILSQLQDKYNVTFERVFNETEQEVNEQLDKGEVDMTEPYFALAGVYNGTSGIDIPRTKHFAPSCTTLGYQSVFITYNPAGSARGLERGAIVGIVVAALVAGSAIIFAALLVSREKQGAPLFSPFQQDLSEGLLDAPPSRPGA